MNGVEVHEEGTGQECPERMGDSGGTSQKTKVLRRGRWTLLALVIAVFFSMGHFAGAYQKEKEQEQLRAKTIMSERFELRGPDDKLKALLVNGQGGAAFLTFHDQAGRTRLSLGIDAKGTPLVSLCDDRGAQIMSVGLGSDDGTPSIVLYDKDDAAIYLGVVKGFGPHLRIGKKGQGQISVFLTEDGSPSVQILDAKLNPRLALGVSGDEPYITLMGNDRVPRASWRVLPDGSASLAFSDGQAKQRLVVMTDKEGRPSIRYVNPDKTTAKEFK